MMPALSRKYANSKVSFMAISFDECSKQSQPDHGH